MAILTGIAYPLEIDPATGNLKTELDGELISGHIISMIETEIGENPMRPFYGTPGILFESEQSFEEYTADVRRRLEREIPQADFIVSGSLGDEGAALLEVAWTLDDEPQDIITVTF